MSSTELNLPRDFRNWTAPPKIRSYVGGNVLGVVVSAGLIALGLIYFSMGQKDLITVFYLGLGFTLILSVPLASIYILTKSNKEQTEINKFLGVFKERLHQAYGLKLNDLEARKLIQGEKVEINYKDERLTVYMTTFVDGSSPHIYFVSTETELPHLELERGSTSFDFPEKFKAKTNTSRVVFGVFFSIWVFSSILLTLLVGVTKIDTMEGAGFLSSRSLFLAVTLGLLIALAFLPSFIRRTSKIPIKMEVVARRLIDFSKKHYDVTLTINEAIHLILQQSALDVNIYGNRVSIRLSTLCDGTDGRLVADQSEAEIGKA